MGRLLISGNTVSIVPDDGESGITTNLKTLLLALKECRKSNSPFDLKSWKLGEVNVFSNLHSYVYRPIKEKVTRNVHVKNNKFTGVKVYLPANCAKWLKLKHGDKVSIENAVIDGERVLILRRVED